MKSAAAESWFPSIFLQQSQIKWRGWGDEEIHKKERRGNTIYEGESNVISTFCYVLSLLTHHLFSRSDAYRVVLEWNYHVKLKLKLQMENKTFEERKKLKTSCVCVFCVPKIRRKKTSALLQNSAFTHKSTSTPRSPRQPIQRSDAFN